MIRRSTTCFMAHALLGLFWVSALPLGAQTLISAEPIVEHDTAWLTDYGVPSPENGVQVLRLTYWTPDLTGEPSVASTALVLPDTNCAVPLLCHIHGTEYLDTSVPSNWQEGIGGVPQGYVYGSQGFACVLPDLLGLGLSPGLHPYLHAASEATACMDAVRAAREYCQQQGHALNGQLFLVGSSAGAHAALATAKAMQEEFPEEFNITALAGMNGPYSVHPVMSGEMTDAAPDAVGVNLAYILLAYDTAYPDLFASYSDFLQAPYDATVPPLYDGEHDKEEIAPALSPVFANMIQPDLLLDLITDPAAPLNLVFRENTPTSWAPDFPVMLCYCTGDQLVAPQNTLLAVDSLEAHGATQITTLMPSDTADHGECGALSEVAVLAWILSLNAGCSVAVPDPLPLGSGFTLAPNPSPLGRTALLFPDPPHGAVRITLFDANSRMVYRTETPPGPTGRISLDPGNLQDGLYVVEARSPGFTCRKPLLVTH
jgi:pimeloyl-ACP methyl ester carboxylesterase